MRLVLAEALHARPASLLVRLASRFGAKIEVVHLKSARRADARSILEVLALAVGKGDEIELVAAGDDAEAARAALVELVHRKFDTDLVPELATGAVVGIGAGRAVVIGQADVERGTDLSLDEAIDLAKRELDALIASLPKQEAALFEPVRPVLAELAEHVRARVAEGHALPLAVLEEKDGAAFDVVEDAQARLLDAINGGDDVRAVVRALSAVPAGEPIVAVVTRPLTPTLVAHFPPSVQAIVAGDHEAGGTSHAAILARGRGVPLARVPDHVIAGIGDGEVVLVDTTVEPSRVWIGPSCTLIDAANARRDAHEAERAEGARASIAHLGIVVRVNVGTARDAVPLGADGVGLLRTEIAFAGRGSAPAAQEHAALVSAVAKKARGEPVVVRLLDGGGDKPIVWLPPPKGAPDARGFELLLAHPAELDAQLAGIVAAREHSSPAADVRVLIPLTRSAADVDAVRARLPLPLPVGAMIESEGALDVLGEIAHTADFLCVGTNDLAASILGVARDAATHAVDRRVLAAVGRIVEAARASGRGLSVTVCGEIAADPEHAQVLIGLGVDALSVAPASLGHLKSALAHATVEGCRALAEHALRG